MGIKTKKKKKFRKWQKNSGAIFEKGGVIMGWERILKDLSNNPLGLSGEEIKEMFVSSLFDESGFRPLEVGGEEVFTLSQQSIDEYENEKEQFGRTIDPIFEYGKPGDRFVQGSSWHTKGVQHPNGETYRFLISFNHYGETGKRGFSFIPNLVTDITISDYSLGEYSFNPTQKEWLVRHASSKIPRGAKDNLENYVNEWADSGNLEENPQELQRLLTERKIHYRLHETNKLLKKVVSHPNYDLPDLIENYNMDAKKTEALKALISDMEVFPESPAFNELRDNSSHTTHIMLHTLNTLRIKLSNYYRDMANRRSYEWLESTARGMGVNIEYDNNNYPTFSYRGLQFTMTTSRLHIQSGKLEVVICVVATKNLPIGDHYLALLGLVVARPEELDVVNFGIKLAEIGRTGNFQTNQQIFIFTPFMETNAENNGFMEFLTYLKTGRHPGEYRRLIGEIQNALIDVFGSTRGFFE